jgi:LAO/AO transport system kinase
VGLFILQLSLRSKLWNSIPGAFVGSLGRQRGIIGFVSDRNQNELEMMMSRLRAGDVRALARAVSLVEDGAGAELVAACRAVEARALRVGITGPPGAGKSTLVDQMARVLRKEGLRVGVIAVDPSSPYSGGALLGDRIRMQGFEGDDGVYIRSMASRGMMGGLARGVENVCVVMEVAGRQAILVETVGVGQDEVDVAGVVDVTVLVLVPGMGDEVQSLKAGVMEVADVFVVNKSDREGAERLEAEILGMQGLSSDSRKVPVVRTVGTTGEGVGELMRVVRDLVGTDVHGTGKSPSLKRETLGTRIFATPIDTTPIHSASIHTAPIHAAQIDAQFGGGLKLDHLGVAVRSIAAAKGFYESLGMVVGHEEVVEFEQVKTAMLPIGDSRIELLEATAEDSTIGRFVAKRGEGLHHIAVKVEDVDAMFTRLKGEGVRLASDAVRVGAGGHRYFFVHPASTGGVLVEIVGGGA